MNLLSGRYAKKPEVLLTSTPTPPLYSIFFGLPPLLKPYFLYVAPAQKRSPAHSPYT